MSGAVATASVWTCRECRVSVRWKDGERQPIPATWVHGEAGELCLKCRRDRASDSAVEAGADGDRADRAKLRKAGLIEFEILRAPERPNNIIARACGSSPVVVAAVRTRIESRTP
jgi:hypothetical protein